MKVLLTDDSMTIRIIIRDLLNALGYSDIKECRNGEEALEALQKDHYDLILLDIHMPKVDGLTVLEKVKSEPCMGNENVPVVLITSDTDYRQIERAKALNAFGYIKKPFRKEGLERAIVAAESSEKKRLAAETASAIPKAVPVTTTTIPKAIPVTSERPNTAVSISESAEDTIAREKDSKKDGLSWMRSILGK